MRSGNRHRSVFGANGMRVSLESNQAETVQTSLTLGARASAAPCPPPRPASPRDWSLCVRWLGSRRPRARLEWDLALAHAWLVADRLALAAPASALPPSKGAGRRRSEAHMWDDEAFCTAPACGSHVPQRKAPKGAPPACR